MKRDIAKALCSELVTCALPRDLGREHVLRRRPVAGIEGCFGGVRVLISLAIMRLRMRVWSRGSVVPCRTTMCVQGDVGEVQSPRTTMPAEIEFAAIEVGRPGLRVYLWSHEMNPAAAVLSLWMLVGKVHEPCHL